MEEKRIGRGLEEISKSFLSDNGGAAEENPSADSDGVEEAYEVHESIDIRRKLVFPRNFEDKIWKILFKYISDDYTLEHIHLKKVVDTSNGTGTEKRNEEIIICVEGSS